MNGCARNIGNFKSGFNQRAFRAAADEGTVGATAEQRVERVHDNRFTSAGLTGENDQPSLEAQLQLIDNREIFDVEFC